MEPEPRAPMSTPLTAASKGQFTTSHSFLDHFRTDILPAPYYRACRAELATSGLGARNNHALPSTLKPGRSAQQPARAGPGEAKMIRRHPPLLLAVPQPSRLQQHQLVIAQHWPPSMRERNFPRVPIRGVLSVKPMVQRPRLPAAAVKTRTLKRAQNVRSR